MLGIQLAARPASAGAFANDLREFESLRDFFGSASITALVDLPFLCLFVAAIWLIGGWVALVPAVAVPLVLAVGLLLQVPAQPRGRAPACSEAARKHGVLVEAINGLETIKSVGAEGRVQRAWERLVAARRASAGVVALLGRDRRPTSPASPRTWSPSAW